MTMWGVTHAEGMPMPTEPLPPEVRDFIDDARRHLAFRAGLRTGEDPAYAAVLLAPAEQGEEVLARYGGRVATWMECMAPADVCLEAVCEEPRERVDGVLYACPAHRVEAASRITGAGWTALVKAAGTASRARCGVFDGATREARHLLGA
ncbi:MULTISPECIES: hypothetical protein [Streptomyces]|uniref:Uncharacterized protein n=1 Tax=Streptomyces evansiae TaxID=3075535 RepID=A0ABU2RA08_9ACTN|nr:MULTISPECIES: hypothetical protein [unclassified Streptomyces]MDT0413242.1 hypothetical protein [Streptomyces sp. DSM 41979]